MLALYLLTQPPYTYQVLFLKANLEHIWHIADPLSLRISIICLRHEQGVIKIHNCIDHLPFLSLSSLEHSSLVPKLLFVCFFFFSVVFLPLSLYTDTITILSVTALTSFQKWNMTCSSNCMCNKKRKLGLHDTSSAAGRHKACWLFWWLKRGWHLGNYLK